MDGKSVEENTNKKDDIKRKKDGWMRNKEWWIQKYGWVDGLKELEREVE